jgi:hypothetical protein
MHLLTNTIDLEHNPSASTMPETVASQDKTPAMVSSKPVVHPQPTKKSPSGPPVLSKNATIPSYPVGQLHNSKNRMTQALPSSHGYDRSSGSRGPHYEHFRHTSGPTIPMPGPVPHRPFPPVAAAQGMMNPMAQFPSNVYMSPPVQHQGYHPFQIHPGQMPLQPPLLNAPPFNQPYQSMGPNAPGFHPAPFQDMANNVHNHPISNTNPRGDGGRSYSQSFKNNALYDPYGPERPDKANFATIPPQQTNRRGGKQGMSKYPKQFRHLSEGNGPKFHEPDYSKPRGQYGDRPRAIPAIQEDPEIVNDREFGCYVDWIGPKNTTVRELHV